MRIETELFNGTRMHQCTYELRDPESIEEWKSAYSAHWISSWDFPNNAAVVFDKPNMWLHEFCHVIEIWVRRKSHHARLLERNYGFVTGKQMSLSSLSCEAWVLSLQSMLSRDMAFSFDPLMEDQNVLKILRAFTPHGHVEGFTVHAFKQMITGFQKTHQVRGVEFYYNAFSEACSWVKENR